MNPFAVKLLYSPWYGYYGPVTLYYQVGKLQDRLKEQHVIEMVKENKEEMAYSLPSNSDVNRLVLYLIHDGQIGENYIPDYNTIVSKYVKLANLRNIKTTNLKDDHHYPCNDDILKEVICSTDRFE